MKKISYTDAILEMPIYWLRECLMDMSTAASTPVFKAIEDKKKDYEIADAVGEAVRERVLKVYATYKGFK